MIADLGNYLTLILFHLRDLRDIHRDIYGVMHNTLLHYVASRVVVQK